ncbi:MAG: hypothetical protein H6Q12_789 [Bacteroidetes bacterium]|nr:hypothetical protein [Bacteroidota bacterium]
MKTKKYIRSILVTAISILLLTACNSEGDKFDFDKKVILVTGTDTDPLVKFVVEDTPSSYTVTASATDKVVEDVTVNFAQDNSLVETYNAEHNTSYYAVPEAAVKIDNTEATIKAGHASSTGINVSVVSTEEFKDGRTYIIPVTIKSIKGGDMDVLPASKTIYLRISRVINFNSLSMSNSNLYSSYIAPDNKIVDLPNYTYEIKCYVNSWAGSPISRLCNFGPKDESVTNLLRFGENGQAVNSLQWVSPGGGLISSTRFNTGQWYTISLTFDGSTYVMYVNGVKDAQLSGSKGTKFQRLELGMSWTGYGSSQRFDGRVAEVRLWNRALTTSELKLGLCGVDPKSEGLISCWKMNEGTGYIFKDATGNGYDMDWSNTWREVNEGQGLVNQNKSGAVSWLMDEKNKCNQ